MSITEREDESETITIAPVYIGKVVAEISILADHKRLFG